MFKKFCAKWDIYRQTTLNMSFSVYATMCAPEITIVIIDDSIYLPTIISAMVEALFGFSMRSLGPTKLRLSKSMFAPRKITIILIIST